MSTTEQYAALRTVLNEKQWRYYLATEVATLGLGISHVARISGSTRETISRGIQELQHPFDPERIRVSGGGRKKLSDVDTKLLTDLEKLVEPKGDPMSLLQWTTKSLAHLVEALHAQQHTIKKSALANLLSSLTFSLKANKKSIEGVSHPDRDEQFHHIKNTCELFEQAGNPIISVDCKKKELIGNFKNNGREWQAKGRNTVVNVYDF